jgi:hypothetical protein
MSTYTVARTVIFFFEVEANSNEEALAEVNSLGIGAAVEEEEVRVEVVDVRELA